MALDAEVEIVAAQVADTAEHASDNQRLETRLQSDAKTRRSASMSRPSSTSRTDRLGQDEGSRDRRSRLVICQLVPGTVVSCMNR